MAATLRNTGMVVVGDLVNDLTDIHPSLKRQVGERLADMALKNSYHKEDIQPYSPMLKSFRVDGRKVIVTTTAIGKLACRDKPFAILRSWIKRAICIRLRLLY